MKHPTDLICARTHIISGYIVQKKMTITIDEAVYAGLHKVIGRGNISRFLEDLARPHVVQENSLEAGYKAMAADLEREAQADEWVTALIDDGANDPR